MLPLLLILPAAAKPACLWLPIPSSRCEVPSSRCKAWLSTPGLRAETLKTFCWHGNQRQAAAGCPSCQASPDAVDPVLDTPAQHACHLLPAEQCALWVAGVGEHQRCNRVACLPPYLCSCIQHCTVVVLLGIQVDGQRGDLVTHLQ